MLAENEGDTGSESDSSGHAGGDAASVGASVLAVADISVVDASSDASRGGRGSSDSNGVPQVPQNRAPSDSSLPQFAQVKRTLGKRRSTRDAEALAQAPLSPAVLAESCSRLR
jgi:hypothetical protein